MRLLDLDRRLIGAGRLVADADHRTAEYAILIGDAWQGMGLGSMLTDCCLDVCSRWGIARVVAETAPDNHRMIEVFDRRHFEIDRTSSADAVRVSKNMTLQPAS